MREGGERSRAYLSDLVVTGVAGIAAIPIVTFVLAFTAELLRAGPDGAPLQTAMTLAGAALLFGFFPFCTGGLVAAAVLVLVGRASRWITESIVILIAGGTGFAFGLGWLGASIAIGSAVIARLAGHRWAQSRPATASARG